MLRPDDILYGIPVKEIARICQVDITTARRWKSGAKGPPQSALMLLSGDLGHLSPFWRRWKIRGEALITPDGFEVSRGDVLSVELLQAQISAWRSEALGLRKQIAEMQYEEQPLPDSPAADPPKIIIK